MEGKKIESKNMNYAFQVEYQKIAIGYKNVKEKQIKGLMKKLNKELIEVTNLGKKNIVKWGKEQVKKLEKNCTPMYFETQYPGMLVGIGYPHQTGEVTGEIQVGFSFDYVTGAAYYPGSSLKGIIRNIFEQAIENELYRKYIADVLETNAEEIVDLKKSINIIFGHAHEDEVIEETMGDIFYGAYVVGADKDIIGLDSITPHGTDPTKNPIPITMLRIMPGVKIAVMIGMRTNNNELENSLFNCKNRQKLYKEMIKDFGIGAKRNVGYGNFKCEEKGENNG